MTGRLDDDTPEGDPHLSSARVAVITGAAAGIGRATAQHLATAGMAVVVADIDDKGARRVALDIHEQGGRAIHCGVDVSSEPDVRRMIATAVEHFGRLDVLHNNAATTAGSSIGADVGIEHADPRLWLRMYEINVIGVMLGCKHAIPVMSRQRGGSIVNTTSAAGLAAAAGNPSYGATKAAVLLLTKQVATNYGRVGIRCNAVAPGLVRTEGVVANTADADMRRLASRSALGRPANEADIAAAVAFLASDASAAITGQVLSVDGGLLSALPYALDHAPDAVR